MPYFISNNNPDCSGWAVEKEDGEVIGCHSSKEDAIAQMVAVSLAEDMEPGGERALPEELNVGDYVMWFNGDNLIQGQIEEIAFDGELQHPETSEILLGTAYNPAALIRVFAEVEGMWNPTDVLELVSFERLREADQLEDAIKAQQNMNDEDDDSIELRQVNLTPPAYMRAAARRGLRLYEEGKGGDGLVPRTIREAREMAAGRVSEDKWIRIAAWIARHMPDLDAPKNSNPNNPEYPGAGLVAHLLWGSGPTKAQARRAMEYAQGVVERIRAEEERHLTGQHDQSTHGTGGTSNYDDIAAEQASYKESLSQSQKDSIENYKGANFISLNEGLRTNQALSAEDAKIQADLDIAIANAPGFAQDVVLKRGIDGEAKNALLNNAKTGDIISDKGFTSTTASDAVVNSFSTQDGATLTIRAPRGTKALALDDPTSIQSEAEVLFGRNTKMRIVEINTSSPKAEIIVEVVQ